MMLPDGVNALSTRALRRLASLPADVALRVINAAPVERRLAQRYDQTRRAYATHMRPLSDEDSAIVQTLERDGVYVTSLDALKLSGTSEMFAQAIALSGILGGRTADVRSTRTATADDQLSHPEIFAWGLSDRLLNLVEAYLGLPVAYDALCYFHSLPDGSETGARVWHLDREDRRMIKMAVYVTDVGEADGPLQFISRSATRRLQPVRYRYRPLAQAELEEHLGQDAINTILGSAGTVIFIDTARHLHRGSPPTASPRSAIYYSYFSRRPRHPFFCERSPLSRSQLNALIEGAPDYQRAAVQWRTELPFGVKWLPRSLA